MLSKSSECNDTVQPRTETAVVRTTISWVSATVHLMRAISSQCVISSSIWPCVLFERTPASFKAALRFKAYNLAQAPKARHQCR